MTHLKTLANNDKRKKKKRSKLELIVAKVAKQSSLMMNSIKRNSKISIQNPQNCLIKVLPRVFYSNVQLPKNFAWIRLRPYFISLYIRFNLQLISSYSFIHLPTTLTKVLYLLTPSYISLQLFFSRNFCFPKKKIWWIFSRKFFLRKI